MSRQFIAAIRKIEGLRSEIFIAYSSFRAYEVMMELLAPNIIGNTNASRNAKAISDFKGFFTIAKHSLNTDFLVSLAKLYDNHRDGTSIPRLIEYIKGNINKLQIQDFIDYNKNRQDIEIAKANYLGAKLPEIEKIERVLVSLSPQIVKLKELRDKRISHLEMKGLEELIDESKPENFDSSSGIDYLTYEEIANLIKEADTILNKISSMVNMDTAEFGYLTEEVTNDTQQLVKLVRDKYDSIPSGIT